MNTKDIDTARLIPDLDRKFNAKECMDEGGIAVCNNGEICRVICIDRDCPKRSIVTLNYQSHGSGSKRERIVSFNDQGVHSAIPSWTLHHPSKFDKDGFPVDIPLPPIHGGFTAKYRGLGGLNSNTPMRYATLDSHNVRLGWSSSYFNHAGAVSCPKGSRHFHYVEYVENLKDNGLPVTTPEPLNLVGCGWNVVGPPIKGSKLSLNPDHIYGSYNKTQGWKYGSAKFASERSGPCVTVEYIPDAVADTAVSNTEATDTTGVSLEGLDVEEHAVVVFAMGVDQPKTLDDLIRELVNNGKL